MATTKTEDKTPIITDTREQKPYKFEGSTESALTTGDYSVEGFEDAVVIERKELTDFYNCLGNDRERFEAELERLSSYDLPVVIVEADFTEALKPEKHGSGLHPNSILGSIASWTAKFGIIFLFTGGRGLAQRMTKKVLEKYYKYES